MDPVRVLVDFNDVVNDGRIRTSTMGAERPLTLGDIVLAYQPGEDMDQLARVALLDASGRVELELAGTAAINPLVRVTVRTETRHIQPTFWDSTPSSFMPRVYEEHEATSTTRRPERARELASR